MTSTLTPTLGEMLAMVRHRAKLKQAELAVAVEVGRTTLIGWEADRGRPPKWRDVVAVVEACNEHLAEPINAEALRPAWEQAKAAVTAGSFHFPKADHRPLAAAA